MRVKLGDVCERGSSSIKQSDVLVKTGVFDIQKQCIAGVFILRCTIYALGKIFYRCNDSAYLFQGL